MKKEIFNTFQTLRNIFLEKFQPQSTESEKSDSEAELASLKEAVSNDTPISVEPMSQTVKGYYIDGLGSDHPLIEMGYVNREAIMAINGRAVQGRDLKEMEEIDKDLREGRVEGYALTVVRNDEEVILKK